MSTDIFDRCRSYTEPAIARAAGLYPYSAPFGGADVVLADTPDSGILMCGANNYLGLTADPRVCAAAEQAITGYGSSRTGSRMLSGNTPLHEELEHELADFLGKPAALVFPTGYQANLGVIAALLSRHDVLITDVEAHASVYDGWSMSRARLRRFAHNDLDDLRRQLAACDEDRGRLVVVDGVYSMSGDLCPLPEVVSLCAEFGARPSPTPTRR